MMRVGLRRFQSRDRQFGSFYMNSNRCVGDVRGYQARGRSRNSSVLGDVIYEPPSDRVRFTHHGAKLLNPTAPPQYILV
jgi:hypothetical protein